MFIDLAQQDYFDDPCFIAYLDYLAYWKKPEYARFVVYPHCLHYLELLQHAEFRQSLRLLETARTLHGAQYKHWRFWRDGTTIADQTASGVKTETGSANNEIGNINV
ncbi:SOH1-domain-containing protein, partial [Syncephalis plumigaleata]